MTETAPKPPAAPDKPGINKPEINKPAIDKPEIEKPGIEKPGVDKPEIDQPGPAEPVAPKEFGGPSGPEPTRYGDWERNGRASDF